MSEGTRPNMRDSRNTEQTLPPGGRVSMKRRISVYPFLMRHWVFFGIVCLAALVGCSIGIGWSLRLRTFDIVTDEHVNRTDLPMLTQYVSLSANLIAIDETQQTMTLDWNVQYPACQPDSPVRICPDVNIFFDKNLLRTAGSDSTAVPNNNFPDPVFFLNGTALMNQYDLDPRATLPMFRTDVALTDEGTGRTAQSYPFDKYIASVLIFAQNVSGSNDPVPILINSTSGLAVGFNAKLIQANINRQFETLAQKIEVTRGPVVRAYVIFVIIAIWLVTLAFVLACVIAVVLGKGVAAEVLLLPVATLFAFTQLRGTLPGAPPGFGADIDFVGTLPCLALLTICAVFTIVLFLFRNPEKNAPWWLESSQEKLA